MELIRMLRDDSQKYFLINNKMQKIGDIKKSILFEIIEIVKYGIKEIKENTRVKVPKKPPRKISFTINKNFGDISFGINRRCKFDGTSYIENFTTIGKKEILYLLNDILKDAKKIRSSYRYNVISRN